MTVLSRVENSVLRSVLSSVLGEDSAITRFITDLVNPAGSMNFSIPQILSGESITMDVYPRSGNSGLPPGAPAVTNNIFQTITFTLTGNMDFIGREGANFFNGFIKNVLVDGRIYKINENFGSTSTLIDSGGGGQNGAALNISESSFFTLIDGNWDGVERAVNGTFNTDIIGWSDASSAGGSIAWNPLGYIDLINTTGTSRASQDISTNAGDIIVFKLSNTGAVSLSYEIGMDTGSVLAGQNLDIPHTATASLTDIQVKNFGAGTTASADNISARRRLEVAS